MKLFVAGINHKTAPVQIREKLSFSPNEIIEANGFLKERAGLDEVLILSTCNRVEIYAVANLQNDEYANKIKSLLGEFHDINPLDFQDSLYIYNGEETAKHLFKVAAGLDSMVIGEMEILGQVKKAYEDAVQGNSTGKVLNRLFQKAFNTAKRIRTDTFITRGSVSVSAVAVSLAKKILGGIENKKVLIIGTGKIGEQLILYLKKNGVKSTLVSNRTFEKAAALADKFGASAVRFDNFQEILRETDIVITSTGAPHYIIHKKDILEVMPKRKQKSLFIIDLAVPRDVEADVNNINNVYLYNIDDLQGIVDKNIALRKDELDNCQKTIDSSCQYFMNWLHSEVSRCQVGV